MINIVGIGFIIPMDFGSHRKNGPGAMGFELAILRILGLLGSRLTDSTKADLPGSVIPSRDEHIFYLNKNFE